MAAPRNQTPKPEASYHTLDSWAHERTIRGLKLPDGHKVDIDLPDLISYAAQGLIPNPLRGIAHLVEKSVELDLAEISDEEREEFYRLQCWVIGRSLRQPDLVKELGSEDAATDWVQNEMPRSSRWFLWNTCMGHGIDADVLQAVMKIARDKVGNEGAARFPGLGPRPDDRGSGGPDLQVAK